MMILDKLFFLTSFVFLVQVVFNFPVYALDPIEIICQDSLCSEYDGLKNNNTVECIVWKDMKGLHFLGIDQIEKGNIGQPGFSSKFTAYSYELASNSIKKESWRIRDFSPNAVNRISYLQNTLIVTDVDSDGIAETCFLYCISGDCCDPWTVKLMLHKNYEKLAIRGEVPIIEEDIESYQKNFDPIYEKYEKRIRDFASEQWDKGIRMHWKDILGDSVVERMIEANNNKARASQASPPKKESPKDRNGQHILQQRKESHNRGTGGD